MQPTYLPWIGYFGLIDSVDEFVLLDTVQFNHRSWQQKNKIKTPNGSLWLTVPVKTKNLRHQLIKDVQIATDNKFPQNHIKSIELNYCKAPFYKEYAPQIISCLNNNKNNLTDLNTNLIFLFKYILKIKTPIILSRDIPQSGKKADLLLSICKNLSATHYISPPGSKNYLDESNCFTKENIPISYFNFNHPTHNQQHGEFIPYLSIIDLIFNHGTESLSIIRKGYE